MVYLPRVKSKYISRINPKGKNHFTKTIQCEPHKIANHQKTVHNTEPMFTHSLIRSFLQSRTWRSGDSRQNESCERPSPHNALVGARTIWCGQIQHSARLLISHSNTTLIRTKHMSRRTKMHSIFHTPRINTTLSCTRLSCSFQI